MSLSLQPIDLNAMGWSPSERDEANVQSGSVPFENVLATPIESLTTVNLDGTGAFDVLMRATKLHLQEEYDSERITGQEYATVYLGALAAVLQTSTQFLLNQQQVHKINADIGLVRQQTVTELTNTDDSIPQGLGFNHSPTETPCVEPVMLACFSDEVSCYGSGGPAV
ncbi:MAG: hypothetical protein KAG92_10055 [Deltaproteobacteria bacterium]|nr:hypothetical protein [Deltaproteobacteria bacterium]